MNKYICSGIVGHDPDLIDKGLKFSVAVKQDDKSTLWIRVLCFGKIADNCKEIVKKSMKVLVEGKLIMSSNDKMSLLADRVEFLTWKEETNND
jgi:single-stranded DNA-binding protein